jgi:hypothetical protein
MTTHTYPANHRWLEARIKARAGVDSDADWQNFCVERVGFVVKTQGFSPFSASYSARRRSQGKEALLFL